MVRIVRFSCIICPGVTLHGLRCVCRKVHVRRELQTSRKWPNSWGVLADHYRVRQYYNYSEFCLMGEILEVFFFLIYSRRWKPGVLKQSPPPSPIPFNPRNSPSVYPPSNHRSNAGLPTCAPYCIRLQGRVHITPGRRLVRWGGSVRTLSNWRSLAGTHTEDKASESFSNGQERAFSNHIFLNIIYTRMI